MFQCVLNMLCKIAGERETMLSDVRCSAVDVESKVHRDTARGRSPDARALWAAVRTFAVTIILHGLNYALSSSSAHFVPFCGMQTQLHRTWRMRLELRLKDPAKAEVPRLFSCGPLSAGL